MNHIDQKYKVEKLRRDIAAFQKRLAAKPSPKPATKVEALQVGWNNPEFCDRVINRLDRQRSILEEVRGVPKAYVSAREIVRELVAMLMAENKGMDRRAAMRQIAKDRPDLLEAMKDEANQSADRRVR
jgi:hypothetical protein